MSPIFEGHIFLFESTAVGKKSIKLKNFYYYDVNHILEYVN
jgi:hypothetical protein